MYIADMKKNLYIFLTFLLIILLPCCSPHKKNLSEIIKSGKITVITSNNANCYYSYRNSTMGFEYELAKSFAEHLGVKLKVKTPPWHKMTSALNKGKGDFVAASLTITQLRKKTVDFSNPYLSIQQYVIIHKDNKDIRKLKDLNGKTIHVRKASSYQEKLQELAEEKLDINLVLHKKVPTEELIRMVAEKEIEITIADSNVALLNRRYYPETRMIFPIENKQSLGWAVRKEHPELLKEINNFFNIIKENGTFDEIYNRYYAGINIFNYLDLQKFSERLETRLPKYKALIKRESKKYGFDWLLIAATIYQESYFQPNAKSYTGVRGLMQITQQTALEMGIKNRLDPEESIKGGVKYLYHLYNRFDKIDDFDKILFALASYNVGYNHVRDAQKIALKKELDPHKWVSLKQVLPLLRFPEYYQDAKYGYARGTEPVRYVERILVYYDILKRSLS